MQQKCLFVVLLIMYDVLIINFLSFFHKGITTIIVWMTYFWVMLSTVVWYFAWFNMTFLKISDYIYKKSVIAFEVCLQVNMTFLKMSDYIYKKSVIAFEVCLQEIESLNSRTLKVNKMCYLPHTIVYGRCFYFNSMFHKLKY
jgi:hypothetical protein